MFQVFSRVSMAAARSRPSMLEPFPFQYGFKDCKHNPSIRDSNLCFQFD